jgi:hypothetical protein
MIAEGHFRAKSGCEFSLTLFWSELLTFYKMGCRDGT